MYHQPLSTTLIVIALCLLLVPLAQASQYIGEWSQDCDSAFKLASMPTAWSFFPEQGPVIVITSVAVDFSLLPESHYSLSYLEVGDEPTYDLVEYRFMLLEARVRPLGLDTVVRTMNGLYTISKEAVIFSWDGNNNNGRAVSPGIYEIEVRGRFVPHWAGLSLEDGYTYSDLDGWTTTAEACTRVLEVEVIDKPQDQPPHTDGYTCADPPAGYYSTVDDTNSTTLRTTLHNVIDDHTRFPYSSTSEDTWDILNNADENPSNETQLLTVYKNEANADGCSSGCAWNREHTWAKSYGFAEDSGNGRIPYTDCHHLRACDPSYNSSRGNLPHNECVSSCNEYASDFNNGFGGPTEVNKRSGAVISCDNVPTENDRWEPWDHRKGDVARTVLYMDIRYEGDTGAMGAEQQLIATDDLSLMLVETDSCGDPAGYQDTAYYGLLSTLVAWSLADPPDADEIRRNHQVWCKQQNRNPFVDYPEWVDCLYNNNCSAGPAFGGIDTATDLDACADTGVEITWTEPSDWNDGCEPPTVCFRWFIVYRDGVEINDNTSGCDALIPGTFTSCVDDTGTNGTTYEYSVEAINMLMPVPGTSDGGRTEASADSVSDSTAPLITVGPTVALTSSSLTASWTTDEAADGRLEWGTTSGSYPDWTDHSNFLSDHSLTAGNLNAETTYYYRVCSTDACGFGPTCSTEQSVTTPRVCDPGTNEPVFINEFHYDNTGDDFNEFIEIAGPAGTNLGDGTWQLELYNGSTDLLYDTVVLSGVIPDEGTGFGALSYAWDLNGVQNGGPDGFALVHSSAVVQFLCYEGSFTAADGTASGNTCTNVGVGENSSTPIGYSLQLSGSGFSDADFSWTGPAPESPGILNSYQTMDCPSLGPDFVGILAAQDVDPCNSTGVGIFWSTPTSWNDGCSVDCTNRGFKVTRGGIEITTGGCAAPDAAATSCVDTTGGASTAYTYEVIAVDHEGHTNDGGASATAGDYSDDATAPTITSAPTHSSSATVFTVDWITDEPADSYLDYGLSSGGTYTDVVSDPGAVTNHSLSAVGLTASTAYIYRICSTDPCGYGPTCSAQQTATTTVSSPCDPGEGTPIFINELHYDNSGTDTGEFIEVAGPAGSNLGSWRIELYNGATGSVTNDVYGTVDLSGVIPDQGSSGFGTLSFPKSSIQNADPVDGLALVNGTTVVQFLCYETGTFVAEGGAAHGMACTNIGVDEDDPVPAVGNSVQLKGTGFVYEDFTWNEPSTESPGAINDGQTFICGASPEAVFFFTATAENSQAKLEWVNPSGADYGSTVIRYHADTYPTSTTDGTEIYNASTGGAGGYASYTHAGLANGLTYYYSVFVDNGGGRFSPRQTVTARPFDSTSKVKWAFSSGATALSPNGVWPGAIGTGAAYAVSNDRILHAMNPPDLSGTEPTTNGGDWPRISPFGWTPMAMNGPAQSRPPVLSTSLVSGSDLVVFLGSEDGYAYAVDAETGTTRWQSTDQLGNMVTACPTGVLLQYTHDYDLLFVGTRDATGDNVIYALNPSDGSTAWSFDNSGGRAIGIISSTAWADGGSNRLYFTSRAHTSGGSSDTVWCLSFTDLPGGLNLEWSEALGDIDGRPYLYDNRLYVGNNAGVVYALDPSDGSTIWSYATGGGAVKEFVLPTFTAFPRLLFLSTTNAVRAIVDQDTTVSDLGTDGAWLQSGISAPSVPLATSGVLYVGAGDGKLYQLDAADGSIDASVTLGIGSAAVGSPSIDVLNGVIYAGTESGAIYAAEVPLTP